MKRSDLWKKIGRKITYGILTLVTPLTLTACSFNYKPSMDLSKYENITEEDLENLLGGKAEDLSKFIDGVSDIGTLTYSDVSDDLIKAGNYELMSATLVRVVDGDTIVVNINNEETKVRLIGVNTPESVASEEYLEYKGVENTQEGKDASEWVKEYLKGVETLYLQKDVSETDKYGRALRYVWLEVPENPDNISEIQTKMLNGILLDKGIAEISIYKPDVKYADEFEAISTHTTDDFEIDR